MASVIEIKTITQEINYLKEEPYPCNYCKTVFHPKALLLHYFKTLIGETPFEISLYLKCLQEITIFVGHLVKHKVELEETKKSDAHEHSEEAFTPDYDDNDPDNTATANPQVKLSKSCLTYECSECLKEFSKTPLFKEHLKTHPMLERPYKCKKCDKTFKSLHNLQRHIHNRIYRQRRRLTYECSECLMDFSKAPLFQEHLKTHPMVERPYKCKRCDKTYQSLQELYKHQRSHLQLKKHKCSKCDKEFTNVVRLRYHVETHTEMEKRERPYKCDFCLKMFTGMENLNKHQRRIHAEVKPHVCENCGKSFATRSELLQHLMNHTGEKPFICHNCGKGFKTNQQLAYHLETHNINRERTYQCDLCNKSFYTNGELVNHKKTHAGNKPYRCRYCEMVFVTNANRVRHERKHTGEKPFKCSYCNKQFQRASKCCHGLSTIRDMG